MRRWLRLILRKSIAPKSVDYSDKMKRRLATLYCFCAWNCCCIAIYMTMKESYPMTEKEKIQPGHYYARLFQAGDVQVYNIRGLTVTGKYTIEGVPKLDPNEEELKTTTEESPDNAKLLN
ncbi:hypothetical protein PV325_011298 [Microctonus aethiopoides]|uniref:Uncharacterized protein n=1 Tax=Microctonus aethiopoides TaxID=144406 RepID=A0AA39F6T9_9HYME|nr:hypothetical protein PV326_007971 [Microctonus aethiopoides]KAK0088605.1 hypothetical protein PV325_011298 [Microctonus aethiopoides]KAK0164025.1 hypothetical protein PV328_002696 [Microctonus aethiopoides]